MERQRLDLVKALQLLYRRLVEASAWKGPLLEEFDGQPLTHEILKSLEVSTSSFDSFVRTNSQDEEWDSSQSETPGQASGSDGDVLPVREAQSAPSAWRRRSSPAPEIIRDQSMSCWQTEAHFATNIWGPVSPPTPHLVQCQSILYRPPLASAKSLLPTQDSILLPAQGFIQLNQPQVYGWADPGGQLGGDQSDHALPLDPWELHADYSLY